MHLISVLNGSTPKHDEDGQVHERRDVDSALKFNFKRLTEKSKMSTTFSVGLDNTDGVM